MDSYTNQSFTRNRKTATMAVIGAGAIGSFVADAASQAGNRVTLCVRTPIRQLEIESGGARWVSQLAIQPDPKKVSPADWVFVATKSQDTTGTAAWLKALIGPHTKVVLLQNGIDGKDLIRPLIGSASLIPSIVYINSERPAPGHITHFFGRRIEVPEGPLAAELAALMGGALEIVQKRDFVTAAWRKLICNTVLNPITALTFRRFEVFSVPRIAALAAGLVREAVAVGNAAGAQFSDADCDDIVAYVCHMPPEGGTSMLYDRIAGRPLEYEYITGAIVRHARQHGVAVPLNEAVYALLTAADGARLHDDGGKSVLPGNVAAAVAA